VTEAKAHWTAVAISIVLLLVGVGAYRQLVEQHEHAIAEIRVELAAHVAAPGHPLGLARVEALERANESTAGVIQRLGDKLDRIDHNLVVLCARTPGAKCEGQ
jgi:hypothetical protein